MRNLIPVLMLVMSMTAMAFMPAEKLYNSNCYIGWRYISEVREIINAHNKKLSKRKEEMAAAELKYNELAGVNKQLPMEELKAKKLFTVELRKAYEARSNARKAFDKIHELQFLAQQDIEEYKTNHPEGYKQLNELKDSKGRKINVYIGRKQLDKDDHGKTFWRYHIIDERITTIQNCFVIAEALSIYIQKGRPNAGEVIAHEKGHIVDILKDPVGYWADSSKWNSMNCQAPGSWNNRYAAPAKKSEKEYTDNNNNSYKREKYISPKH